MKELNLVFVLVKALQFVLARGAQFDQSNAGATGALRRLMVWDNVYFGKLFDHGVQYDHEWVFSPLWWRLVHYTSIYTGIDSTVVGFALSNLFHYLSCLMMYRISLLYFRGFSQQREIARLSAVLSAASPSGIFLSVPYSENLSNLLAFTGLYCLHRHYLLSCVFFALSFCTRSNALVLGVIYLYDLLVCRNLRALLCGTVLFASFLALNLVPYFIYCPSPDREWCASTFPSLVVYAQSRYWDNGFLKYYTPNNLFNFVITIPIIVLLLKSSLFLWRFQQLRSLSLTGLVFTVGSCLFINIQILNRISSFLPIVYWYLAILILQKRGKYWLLWVITWNLLQTVLFACYLPPA